jgi:hypothetical protein
MVQGKYGLWIYSQSRYPIYLVTIVLPSQHWNDKPLPRRDDGQRTTVVVLAHV